MNLQELFFKLTAIQRAAIVVAVGVLLLIPFYFFVVAEKLNEIDQKEKEIGRVKIEIINQQKILAQGPELKQKIQNLSAQLQSMVASLPQKQDIEALLKKITDLLSESNLVAARFVPGAETINPQLQYAAIPISLSVRGDYVKHGSFLASLRELPRIVNVPTITLKKAGGLTGRESDLARKLDVIALDAEISGVTYRRLTPEEIKALAQPKPGQPRRR